MNLNLGIRRHLYRWLNLKPAPTWDQVIRQIDFRSGLGDSSWVLYGLCRSLHPSVCVEIGSARGRSACFIGKALKDNGSGILHAIDPHAPTSWNDTESVDTLELLNQNLSVAGVTDQVRIIRQNSEVAAAGWKGPIDLLFIDGDHSYNGVKRDWELFSPFVPDSGVVVFHDTLWDIRPDPSIARADMGVPRFVEELRTHGFPVITLCKDFGVSLVQPVAGGKQLSRASASCPNPRT